MPIGRRGFLKFLGGAAAAAAAVKSMPAKAEPIPDQAGDRLTLADLRTAKQSLLARPTYPALSATWVSVVGTVSNYSFLTTFDDYSKEDE